MKNIIVTGANGALSCKVANHLKTKPDFNVKQLSLRGDWENSSFKDIYSIVHIAGVTPQNAKSEKDYKAINYELTKSLSDKAKLCGVKQFIFISSMAVYGASQSTEPKKGIINADTPCNPTEPYGKSKFMAEQHLLSLADKGFKVCIIRVPSIFDNQKTEYIDQYKYLADKYPLIPKVFTDNYKSFIHSKNLCELIYLALVSDFDGVICPDDGKISTYDICRAIYPKKPISRIAGWLIRLILKHNPRIVDYYGAIYYSDSLTDVFDLKYRLVDPIKAIEELYEKQN